MGQQPTGQQPTGRRAALREGLFGVRSAPGSARNAVRTSLCVLIPLLVLLLTDSLALAGYAVFGAFAAVYGGPSVTRRRWRTQAAMGGLLTAAVGSGVLVATTEHRAGLLVAVCAVWAGLAAALSDRFAWVPPGPMFPVFAAATAGAHAAQPSMVAPAVLSAAVVAAAAVGLGVLDVALFGERQRSGPPPMRSLVSVGRRRMHALRCPVAVAVAGALALPLAERTGTSHPYWAMIAAVVPLVVPGLAAQLSRGVHRVVGTGLGIGVATGFLLLDLPAAAIVAVVVVLQAVTELLVVRHYGAAMVAITPLALLLGQLAAPQPVGALVEARLLETLLGVGVGVLVAVLTSRTASGYISTRSKAGRFIAMRRAPAPRSGS